MRGVRKVLRGVGVPGRERSNRAHRARPWAVLSDGIHRSIPEDFGHAGEARQWRPRWREHRPNKLVSLFVISLAKRPRPQCPARGARSTAEVPSDQGWLALCKGIRRPLLANDRLKILSAVGLPCSFGACGLPALTLPHAASPRPWLRRPNSFPHDRLLVNLAAMAGAG